MICQLTVVKDILNNMPLDATEVRINRDWGIFYKYNLIEKRSPFNTPHRYLRYCNRWVPLSIPDWGVFKCDNQVMNAFEFRFLAHKQYFIELKGIEFAKKVVSSKVEGATHYNFLSNMYYRSGSTNSEYWTGDSHHGWCESTMSNEVTNRLLISIKNLEIKLKEFHL